MLNVISLYITTLWNNVKGLDAKEERGAEAIEWIAMVAIILLFLLAAQPLFEAGGATAGGQIVAAIVTWIGKFI